MAQNSTSNRGFAAMPKKKVKELAQDGGHSQGKHNNPGNFANDREKASEAGKSSRRS